MTTLAMKQTAFPQHPHAGRKLCTYDDLMDEIEHHFLPGQYVHVEQWTTTERSEDNVEYTMTEGFISDSDDWEFLFIGEIDRKADKPSEKRLCIDLTGDGGAILPTVAATGTLVIPDPSAPNVTYQITSRTPVFNGPSVTGCLTNDRGQESPYDVTVLKQRWLNIYQEDVQRHDSLAERTVYRHEVRDDNGKLMGCVETSDGGQTWEARKWYAAKRKYSPIEGFEATESITDNAQLVYLVAGGTGRWTKRTMIEVPLPFEIAA